MSNLEGGVVSGLCRKKRLEKIVNVSLHKESTVMSDLEGGVVSGLLRKRELKKRYQKQSIVN
jgi:hypothetical protein